MKTIHKLSDHVVSKIAAGEVIERPVYAIKELIENAIDAQADEISIEFEDGGLKKISVYDNGIGMGKEDIEESFKPHTTSKIIEEDDLLSIRSLGFRGEALSSIASISYLTIQSKKAGDMAGRGIHVVHGVVKDTFPVGMPEGTTVIVEQLFSNVPARKKFLKTGRTQKRHLVDMVVAFALSYPHIHFLLKNNKKILLDAPKNQTLEQRIKMVLGSGTLEQLLPLNNTTSYFSLSGYISHPQLTTISSQKLYLFVNGRYITSKELVRSLKDAYGTLLAHATYPVGVLFLTLPFEMVDVNIHPRKEQISFADSTFIYDTLRGSVAKTLSSHNLSYTPEYWQHDGGTSTYAAGVLREEVIGSDLLSISRLHKDSECIQLLNLYVVTQTDKGIVLIDQHAAHERILYEQFKQAFKKNILKEIITLTPPKEIELSLSEVEILKEHTDIFKGYGFDIQHRDSTLCAINTIPELLRDRDLDTLIRELIADIAESGLPKAIDEQSDKMLTYLACRGAIKRGDPLTPKQCKDLINELHKTPNSYSCPHGRPTRVELPVSHINRLFKRTS